MLVRRLSKGSISGMDSQVEAVTKVRTSKPPVVGSALILVLCNRCPSNKWCRCQKVARIMNSPSRGGGGRIVWSLFTRIPRCPPIRGLPTAGAPPRLLPKQPRQSTTQSVHRWEEVLAWHRGFLATRGKKRQPKYCINLNSQVSVVCRFWALLRDLGPNWTDIPRCAAGHILAGHCMGLGVWQTSNSMSRQIPQIPKQPPQILSAHRRRERRCQCGDWVLFTFGEEFRVATWKLNDQNMKWLTDRDVMKIKYHACLTKSLVKVVSLVKII